MAEAGESDELVAEPVDESERHRGHEWQLGEEEKVGLVFARAAQEAVDPIDAAVPCVVADDAQIRPQNRDHPAHGSNPRREERPPERPLFERRGEARQDQVDDQAEEQPEAPADAPERRLHAQRLRHQLARPDQRVREKRGAPHHRAE